MKKIIYLGAALLAALTLASCTSKVEKKDKVSFVTALPAFSDGVATLKIESSYSGTEAVNIPVEFGGTAVKGTDYNVSAEAFVLGGNKPVKEISLTPIEYGTKKTVTLSLKLPMGFEGGRYPVSTFTLSDKIGYRSFETKASLMAEKTEIVVNIVDGNAKNKIMEKETKIPVKVVAGKSTAVEGAHFEFENGPYALVPQGSSTGKVTIKIKGEVLADNDLLTLAFDEDKRFGDGQYIETSVKILGSAWNSFAGKWKVTELHSTFDEQKAAWGDGALNDSDANGYPVLNAEDKFTIDTEKGLLLPEFKSELKNFFIGQTSIAKDKEMVLNISFGKKVTLRLFSLDNVNRNFDAASQSEDKQAFIGVHMSKDDENKDVMSLYVLDYKPTSFLQSVLEWNYEPNKPMATNNTAFFTLTCKRAE